MATFLSPTTLRFEQTVSESPAVSNTKKRRRQVFTETDFKKAALAGDLVFLQQHLGSAPARVRYQEDISASRWSLTDYALSAGQFRSALWLLQVGEIPVRPSNSFRATLLGQMCKFLMHRPADEIAAFCKLFVEFQKPRWKCAVTDLPDAQHVLLQIQASPGIFPITSEDQNSELFITRFVSDNSLFSWSRSQVRVFETFLPATMSDAQLSTNAKLLLKIFQTDSPRAFEKFEWEDLLDRRSQSQRTASFSRCLLKELFIDNHVASARFSELLSNTDAALVSGDYQAADRLKAALQRMLFTELRRALDFSADADDASGENVAASNVLFLVDATTPDFFRAIAETPTAAIRVQSLDLLRFFGYTFFGLAVANCTRKTEILEKIDSLPAGVSDSLYQLRSLFRRLKIRPEQQYAYFENFLTDASKIRLLAKSAEFIRSPAELEDVCQAVLKTTQPAKESRRL